MQAAQIGEALEKAGANVWQREPLPEQRVVLRVSYTFDWKTIEGISQALDAVQRSQGAQLEESPGHHNARTSAVRTLERERAHIRRGPKRNRGMGID